METDASGVRLGAVLAQRGQAGETRPIAFASRMLQGAEKRYSVTELEALGVVWAVKHFRHYIYGHHCTVITDHQPLRSLLNTPHPSGKLARWGLALQEVNLEIVCRPGCKNSAADALSRVPLHSTSGRDGGYEVKVVNCEIQTEHTLVPHTPCKPTNAYTFNRSLLSLPQEELLSSPQEEESLSPQEEESLSSPQEEELLSLPQEESSLSSPQEEESLLLPQEEESLSPQEEESLSSPQEEELSSPQEEESLSSPQEEESLSSLQEESLSSPQEEESLSSPKEEELLSSLQEEESSLQLAGDISTEELLTKRTHVSNTHTQDNINMFPLCTHVQTPAHAYTEDQKEIRRKQIKDPRKLFNYLEEGMLPRDDKDARKLTLESRFYTIVDGVLYRIQPDKTLALYVARNERRGLFDEAHSGIYGSHQRAAKIHATLSNHFGGLR